MVLSQEPLAKCMNRLSLYKIGFIATILITGPLWLYKVWTNFKFGRNIKLTFMNFILIFWFFFYNRFSIWWLFWVGQPSDLYSLQNNIFGCWSEINYGYNFALLGAVHKIIFGGNRWQQVAFIIKYMHSKLHIYGRLSRCLYSEGVDTSPMLVGPAKV